MELHKEKLLNSVRVHIDSTRKKIQEKLEDVRFLANRTLAQFSKLAPEDQMAQMHITLNAQARLEELIHLESSPYFMKCDIINEEGEHKTYFFGKHEFTENSIYSWIAPIAAIRFENPGVTSFKLPTGEIKPVTIKQKEQYMIVDGKILFFAIESQNSPRELIYQEHFTKQKSEFALPEIVAQMEKAQDQVIRASHKGSLVIGGPAGSGKTTLALHRVAYLTQAPETSEFYPTKSIIVFVQDTGTKNYFSTLLPGLGIHDVQITTFSEWAFSILGLNNYQYHERYGSTDEEKDLYEYHKIRALRESVLSAWNENIFGTLFFQYKSYFSKNDLDLFNKQKEDKTLDRFDITILLMSYFEKYQKFETIKTYQTFIKGKQVQKTRTSQIKYSLAIIDEFQNYLPEQLTIINKSLNEKTKSSLYVGDIGQQVKLGTIKDWSQINEIIIPERNIRLNKVYRNTKHILSFIQSLGYKIEVPEGLKDGPVVTEKVLNSPKEEIDHIKSIIGSYEKGTIGILSKYDSYLEPFRSEFKDSKNIHVLTMIESQGVEFDLVIIVGMEKESFEVTHYIDVLPEHIAERKLMQKDLLYVALTRAITELHVLGKERLSDIIKI